ncbi:MAG: hypothetical protein M1816_000026 [Peltula sp. TS41687]|nr:MAG: hypothetical protein M1816_000026 [Peltula sp. TS41687]
MPWIPSPYHHQTDDDDDTDSTFSSSFSGLSEYSLSTLPTSDGLFSRPSSCRDRSDSDAAQSDVSFACSFDPRASTETYASTVPSEEDLEEDDPNYFVPEVPREELRPEPIASTPPEFAQLFSSTRRLQIAHDDTTEDGNMNLRVDTKVSTASGRSQDFTLFHLRMYDLKNREFSLRRYCRDSGREICHSSRTQVRPAADGGGLQRSMNHALSSLWGKQEPKTSKLSGLKRQDSGNRSDDPGEFEPSSAASSHHKPPPPCNTIKLEFSNYAQVKVKRQGTKNAKRYEWKHWGLHYTWKRSIRKQGSREETSYHLVNDVGGVLARILPVPLTTAQARREAGKGGWIPPCSMWITDERALRGQTDVAE